MASAFHIGKVSLNINANLVSDGVQISDVKQRCAATRKVDVEHLPLSERRLMFSSFSNVLEFRSSKSFTRSPKVQCASRQFETPPDAIIQTEIDAFSDVETQQLQQTNDAEVRVQVSRKIRQFGKTGKLKSAIEAVRKMQDSGVAPDNVLITSLMDCCIRSKNISMAEDVFNSMFTETLRPDAITFTVLFRAYGTQDPPQWIKIQQLLGRMEMDFDIVPTTSVFNELIDVCSRINDVEKGMDYIERMQALKLEPDWFTFEAIKRRKTLRAHFRKVFGK